ncbi:phosphotransferase family protein [Sphingobium sp. EM0848]|uniref:phosphotransferase family protein n=1 Tax=Sphingobium sp. EM0848 TaxID=2743473 RepID=UPI00159C4867|nr:phosphotransferase family protein [Sphingobium sp. EM0848]
MERGLGAQAIALALDRLGPVMAPDDGRILQLGRLTGGASLETWAFDLATADGLRPLILRRRDAVEDTIFSTSLPLATEAALLERVAAAGVPVAQLIRLCAEADGLGEAYIVTRIAGETLGRRIVAADAFAPARTLLGAQAGQALAAIHRIDPTGLPPLETLDARGSLARYEAIHHRIGAQRPVLEAAFRLLDRDAPPPVAPQLVHGDFRNGNLIVDSEQGLVAVLDWELAHLGDPAEDLGWLCVNSWRFGETALPVGGFATLEALLDAYRAAGGDPPPVSRIRYWQMLGSLKWAIVCLMMYESFASGEERTMERAAIGRRLSECEVDLLALMQEAA